MSEKSERTVGLYVPLEVTAPRHPKIRKLARKLRVSAATALGHMATLWCELLSQSPDGWVEDSESVEMLAEWDGDEGAFTDAAVSVGLLDVEGDGYRAHDYYNRLSHLRQVRQRKQTRDRVRKHRERKAQQGDVIDSSCNANSVTSALQSVTCVTVAPEQEQEQKQEQSISSPSTELDTSSDAPATFKPDDEEDRIDMSRGDGGVEPQGMGDSTAYPEPTPELPPGVPTIDEVIDAVKQVEASAWMPVGPPRQPVDAATESNPTQQPDEPPIGRDGEPRRSEPQGTARNPRRDTEANPDKCPPSKGSEPESHNGCSVPLGGRKSLDELAEYDSLNGGSVEYYVHASGVDGVPPLGSAGLCRLTRLTPIMAWELRQALAAARAVDIIYSADGYLATCIEGYRRDGVRPAPRAMPEPETPPSSRESTDRQVLRRNRDMWGDAIGQHGLPLDTARLDDLERRGPPDKESYEQLRDSRGSWTEFDRLGSEMKEGALGEVVNLFGRVPDFLRSEKSAQPST